MSIFETIFKPKPKTEVLPRPQIQEKIDGAVQLNQMLDAIREREAQRERERVLEQAENELSWAKGLLLKGIKGGDERTDYRQRLNAEGIVKSRELLPRLRPASVEDYKGWLRGFLRQGGNVSNSYDYNMPKKFFVATKDFEMFPFYGAEAIEIIVPHGVKFIGGDLGHCNLYFEDGYRVEGNWVPIYKDVKF